MRSPSFTDRTQPLSPYQLGATLYLPATRTDIDQVILHNKVPGLSSLVICLEDAVQDDRVSVALQNLTHLLSRLNEAALSNNSLCSQHQPQHQSSARHQPQRPLVFIRPRNLDMAQWLIDHLDLSCISGFVLPKFTLASLDPWASLLEPTSLYWMPTLESIEVFDPFQMQKLAATLEAHPLRERILAIRIGGNDLMNLLSLRRQRNLTIYQTPLAHVIQTLVCQFAPRDFALTAPVCEIIDDPAMLATELEQDIAHGLVGKTAIHPSQVKVVNRALMVSHQDHQDAQQILEASQAVFKSHGAMCEPATQHRWARNILIRARYYGVINPIQVMPQQPQQNYIS